MQEEYTVSRVGDRLRSVVKARGQTLKGFASLVDIPYRSFQDYVAGKSKPGFEQLQKIARSGVDIGFVLTGTETRNYLSDIRAQIKMSSLLASDDELAEVLTDYLLDTVDAAIPKIPSEYFLGSPTQLTLSIWEKAVQIAVETVEEMSPSLIELRSNQVSSETVVRTILEVVDHRLAKAIKNDAPAFLG